MKFKRIKINNFMRYKGSHEIEFSCDDEKNVTVVMGENTFGKTTLAQAFRWGLYGEIIDTKYGKQKNAMLLNKDVLAGLTNVDDAEVSVELEVVDEDITYIFRRDARYARKFPSMSEKRIEEKLWLRTKNKDERWSDWIDNSSSKNSENGIVEEKIKLLFPKDLSAYFFFDGEKWSDERKSNNELKKSISTLMGITPLVKMKDHLFNEKSKCLVKQLKKRISGNSNKFDELNKSIDTQEELIERWEKEKEQLEKEYEEYREKVNKAQEILDSNKRIEEYQEKNNNLIKSIEKSKNTIKSDYADIVREFSKSGYKYFAMSMLDEINNILEDSINNEVDTIPDITTDTIEYLIRKKKCICGNDINDREIEYLNKLRDNITGNISAVKIRQFENKMDMWKTDIRDFTETIIEKANDIEGLQYDLEKEEEEKRDIEEKIDNKINFRDERKRMNANAKRRDNVLSEISKREGNIESAKKKLKGLEEEKRKESANTLENRRIQRMIDYAEALYDETADILKKREEPLIDELNVIIRENFIKMFNEKEKYARMEEDYKLHLYYSKFENGVKNQEVEELNLSEGEIIARNFVFIVSILELAQQKKKEDDEKKQKSDVLNLPLVLDGPFSKLSDKNIGLIAEVLPEAAEQVIIFMLDKDWDASGLDKYTLPGYKYEVKKEPEENSARIVRKKV